jgi:Ni/Co efflux regulator RcnB
VWPRGYSYRRWGIGALLPSVFLAQAYFYTGWGALGLQAPVPGYTWVRYGPDLLLVNLTTREIEDVIYGVFL